MSDRDAGLNAASPAPDSGARASLHIYRLGRACSLGKRKQFTYVYKRGKSVPGKYLTLVYLRAREHKVGFSVSAKVGNSVRRNRVRRCLREDFRLLRPRLAMGKYIFVARPAAGTLTHKALTHEMKHLLSRAGLIQPEGGDQR